MARMSTDFTELFTGTPAMGIFRGMPAERAVELARRAWDLGVNCVEIPLQDKESSQALEAVAAAGRERGEPVGAGTITSIELVHRAVDLGAEFTVAPGLDPAVAEASLAAGCPHLPGVATASEIQRAHALGLRWLKAFPASVLGTDWFRAMRGPFPETEFVATGGIDADNAADFLDAGARVVAVGSALADPAQLDKLSTSLARFQGDQQA